MSDVPFVEPDDEHNRTLVAHTHPPDWPMPTVKDRYDVVVIGGGPGGLVAAMGAAGVGASVALVEEALLGGDCLVSGCVPSKALLKSARVAMSARSAAAFGVNTGPVDVDFGAVMERMRRVRAGISPHDAAARFADAGIDVFLGRGVFTGHDTVDVSGTTLRFKRAIIATGAHARRPDLPGIDDVRMVDNHGLFELTTLPGRLVVVGGGVIGCEVAQAMAAFGSTVTVIERGPRLLGKVPESASRVLTDALVKQGVTVLCDTEVTGFRRSGDDHITCVNASGETSEVAADLILMSIGRVPTQSNMGLEAAGVSCTRHGITVDDFLMTDNPRIYAVGDVASPWQFTHAADAMARITVRNALFFGRKRHSALVVPSATFTEPEVATVGRTEPDSGESRYRSDASELDRTVVDANDDGFLEVIADAKGRIVGAVAVGERAGDLISMVTLAMVNHVGLSSVADLIVVYPTESELFKRCGDAFNKTRLSPFAARVLKTIVQIRR